MGQLRVEGYASLFWKADLNDDIAAAGAFADSLIRTGPTGVRMLYQHDTRQPIGVWDQVFEDQTGLFVSGRILELSPEARLCSALIKAGALDGLSIGFRTISSRADESGRLRVLTQIDLWEVSLVTFPMLPQARLQGFEVLQDQAA
jgi:HK97 family phage prohead protease